jgi:amino acid adenylation domain-containing protein
MAMASLLGSIDRVASARSGTVAVTQHLGRDAARSISAGELRARSERVARHLMARGVKPGDFVGVYMRRSVDHVTALVGIMRAGAVFYSMHHGLRLPQIRHICERTLSTLILTDVPGLLSFAGQPEDAALNGLFTLFSTEPVRPFEETALVPVMQAYSVRHLMPGANRTGQAPADGPPPTVVGQDAAFVLFTSGSTGNPKGVVIAHQDLANRVVTESADYGIVPDDRLLSLLPFSFDVGCNQLFTALASGAGLVILNSWLPRDIATVVAKYGITGISAVPAIWAGVLECATNREIAAAIDRVRYITISGGDMAPSQLSALRELLPSVQIFKTYGQTETFRSSMLKPDDFSRKMGSVGRPISGTDVIVVDRKGQPVAPGGRGQIVHRGDGVMLGYLGDKKATRAVLRPNPLQSLASPFRQRAVFTGDTGYFDADGYLYLMGRSDKMIKTSGYRVYPREVSDHILRHPAVKDAVVFGVKHPTLGNALHCEIELKEGFSLTPSEMTAFLADKLPSYMIPVRIEYVTAFPRTPSGKIRLSEVERKYHG